MDFYFGLVCTSLLTLANVHSIWHPNPVKPQFDNCGVLSLSSQYVNSKNEDFTASMCLDGNLNTMCHTTDERYPYLVMEYPNEVLVKKVKVVARAGSGPNRVKQLVVSVTNVKPTRGKLVSGGKTLGTFAGPASPSQEIMFKSAAGLRGKYVVIQQRYTGFINYAEIEITKETPDVEIPDKQEEANPDNYVIIKPTPQKFNDELNKHGLLHRKKRETFTDKKTWCFWIATCASAHYYKHCCKNLQPYCPELNCEFNRRSCDIGWASVGGVCYHIVNAETFKQAKGSCDYVGGSLVEIRSQAEQDALRTFYEDSPFSGWVWLGAKKTKEDEWRWIYSEKKITFNLWESGQPNNAEGNENCLLWDGNKFWKGISCEYRNRSLKAICEKRRECLSTTLSTTTSNSETLKPSYCGRPNRNQNLRVWGGQTTEQNEYPWQVALMYGYKNTPFCGGSIISRETVLTAAHCTEGLCAEDITVLIGKHNVTDDNDGQIEMKVKQIIQHDLYNSSSIDYDFSLLILERPVIYSKKAKPIRLPNQTTNYENFSATVLGWGTHGDDGLTSDILREADVMTMTNTECTTNKRYRTSEITARMICASGSGVDACNGDSGGPLVSEEEDGYFSIIGVVSWGRDCASADSPGVYSRVANQISWIRDNMVGQACVKPADSIYFIAGGKRAHRDMELYHPTKADLSCSMSPPPLNNNWDLHTTFYYNNTIHLYGGMHTASTCISYSINTEKWKTHTLSTSRKYGHSSVVLKQKVFIIGGRDTLGKYVGAESTPLPVTDHPVLTPVLNLDYKGTLQCTTKVDEDTLVVTGGYYRESYLSSVIEYNAKTRTRTSLPSMKQPRSHHGCAMVEMDNTKRIIVAGGYNYADGYLESTEMLQIGKSSWTSFGNLNGARHGHSISVTQRGVMAMGGNDGSRVISSVELLDWSAKSWRIVQPSLSKRRAYFGGAVEIPASMFDC